MLSAGGTGGHLFPAEALASVLTARGWRVELITDTRVAGISQSFPAQDNHVVPSGSMSPRKPFASLAGAFRLIRGYMAARKLIGTRKPDIVIGFGGYPTLPPLIAAAHLGAPTLIHDQNAVMGRANRVVAPLATAIATSFDEVKHLEEKFVSKSRRVGVPVRKSVIAAADRQFDPPEEGGPLRLLVFGGSQGARVMSDIVPPALAMLDDAQRKRLHVVQQCRSEDLEYVRGLYADAGIEAELDDFFTDLPQRMAAAHLVISRSGASTIAELGVIGRPAIMVPLPHALDNDQLYNARAMEDAGGGKTVEQRDFTPEALSKMIGDYLADPASLTVQAAAARRFGMPRAAEVLADHAAEIAL